MCLVQNEWPHYNNGSTLFLCARHRSLAPRRIFYISGIAVCVLGIQLPLTPKTGDASVMQSFPVPTIGIQQLEAQPIEEEPSVPVRLDIPSIGVDARIVPVGLMDGGKLDVPVHPADVGWYELGVYPGNKGNAVLDGHLDIGSTPGVFWHLRHLPIGEYVYVTDQQGTRRTFRVTNAVVYDVHNAPMMDIFGPTDARRLNIITCAGVWRNELNHYDKRLIVFTELVEE